MKIYTVTELNQQVKKLLEEKEELTQLFLSAEISNFKNHSSGHYYLSLKDNQCSISAVMFAGNARKLKFMPENGMKVLVRGYVSLYPERGQYQMYLQDMQPDGAGALSIAFEQLKKRLEAEGLFAPEHKKPLPYLPNRIAAITSETGAAIRDILQVLERRYPLGEIILCPVQVQGEGAAQQLTAAVKKVNELKCADVIIIGRGGGSAEELWEFNDETFARAIYASEIPVVSAVGHEIDFTICDFVADMRAPTPSAAAELVSPEKNHLLDEVIDLKEKIKNLASEKMENEKSYLKNRQRDMKFLINTSFSQNQKKNDFLSQKLKENYSDALNHRDKAFRTLSAKLDALSPLKVLSRGYSIALKDHRTVSASEINAGDELELILTDGNIKCTVTERSLNS